MGKIRDYKGKEIKLAGYCKFEIAVHYLSRSRNIYFGGGTGSVQQKMLRIFFPLRPELSIEEIFCGGGEDKGIDSFCLMASNKGQSEPVGTGEKQGKRSFSLSIRKDRLFIRKVVLLQTNFRRNLLCEAK